MGSCFAEHWTGRGVVLPHVQRHGRAVRWMSCVPVSRSRRRGRRGVLQPLELWNSLSHALPGWVGECDTGAARALSQPGPGTPQSPRAGSATATKCPDCSLQSVTPTVEPVPRPELLAPTTATVVYGLQAWLKFVFAGMSQTSIGEIATGAIDSAAASPAAAMPSAPSMRHRPQTPTPGLQGTPR